MSQPRSISPVEESSVVIQVPLMGYIAAGNPIEPLENPEPVDVPANMLQKGFQYYALKVKGDSMINDDVWDNDVILIRHQQNANVGDMIVASTDSGVTLKRFGGKEGNKVILIPRNPNMNSIKVDAESFEVRGKFAGLIRRNN